MTEKRKEQFKASQKKLRLKQKTEGKKTISFTVSKELFSNLKELKKDKSYSDLIEELIDDNKNLMVILIDQLHDIEILSKKIEEYEYYDNRVKKENDFFDKLAFFRRKHPNLIEYQERELRFEFSRYPEGSI